jgi:hypothetical protein
MSKYFHGFSFLTIINEISANSYDNVVYYYTYAYLSGKNFGIGDTPMRPLKNASRYSGTGETNPKF